MSGSDLRTVPAPRPRPEDVRACRGNRRVTQGCSEASMAAIGAVGDDPAVGQRGDAVADRVQAVEIVRDHEYGQPERLLQRLGSARRNRRRRSGRGPRSARRGRRSRDRAPARGRAPRAWSCRPRAPTETCRASSAVEPDHLELGHAPPRPSAARDRSRYSRIGNCMFCSTVSEENSAPCWNRTPQRRSMALPLGLARLVEIDAEHLDRALRASAAGR